MPLKKVVETVWATGRTRLGQTARILQDKLECGHLKPVSFDKFGRRIVRESRRCKTCDGIRSQMRPDFSQER